MHPIFHSYKRLHWSSMRFARDWAGDYGMTPARFDAMLVIDRRPEGIAQADIHLILDVVEPVISRMMKSLEKRGFIERLDHPSGDERMWWVTLTERGRHRVRLMTAELLLEGFTEQCLRLILAPDATSSRAATQAVRRVHELVRRERVHVLDNSTHTYPAYLPTGERNPDHPVRGRDAP